MHLRTGRSVLCVSIEQVYIRARISDTSPNRVLASVSATALEPATRFAAADLVASVLQLDFWDDDQPSTM